MRTMLVPRLVPRLVPLLALAACKAAPEADRPGGEAALRSRTVAPAAARVAPIEIRDATPAQRAYLEPHARAGRLVNVFKTAAHHPDFARSFDAFMFGHVSGETSTLTPRQRELLVLRMAWLCQCEYAWAQHARLARSIGFTEEDLLRIAEGPDASGWSRLDAALLRAAGELRRGATVSDATWDTLAEHLDTRQLMDVVATAGGYDLACMMLNSLGVQLDEGLAGFPE